MIIYVNDYDVGIEALPTPTITLLLLLLYTDAIPLLKSSRCSMDFVGKWQEEAFREFEEEEE